MSALDFHLSEANEKRNNVRVDIRDHLAPKKVVDLIIERVQRRVLALENVRLREYTIALYELRTVLDLLTRGSKYIENHDGRRRGDGK